MLSVANQYTIRAQVWLYPGAAAWHFITLPKTQSKKIRTLFIDMKRGWGSLPVIVRIGETEWKTSIFPDTKRDAYLLPIKASVRKKEKIKAGDRVVCRLTVSI